MTTKIEQKSSILRNICLLAIVEFAFWVAYHFFIHASFSVWLRGIFLSAIIIWALYMTIGKKNDFSSFKKYLGFYISFSLISLGFRCFEKIYMISKKFFFADNIETPYFIGYILGTVAIWVFVFFFYKISYKKLLSLN